MANDQMLKLNDTRDSSLNSGMRWLFEHELLGSAAAQEAIWWNVALQSTAIKNTEPLIDQFNKKMLIYVELKWWGFLKNKKNLSENIINVLQQALPAYSFRVVFDRHTLDKAKELLEKIYGKDSIE